MQKQISILGCGWLGFPLAKFLLEKNYKVNGSTINPSKLDFLHKKGIKSFLIELNPELKNAGKFFHAETESGKALVEVEKFLRNETEINITILRFGGLIGYERNPGNFLAGKSNLKDGNAPVILIHRDDCVSIIYNIIENNIWNETFNACMPEHPTKKDFYTAAALKLNLSPPQFDEDGSTNYKIINPAKLINALNYKFIYSNPMETL